MLTTDTTRIELFPELTRKLIRQYQIGLEVEQWAGYLNTLSAVAALARDVSDTPLTDEMAFLLEHRCICFTEIIKEARKEAEARPIVTG